MDLMLRGKRAVITGASKGIGFAIAKVLAAEGCSLVLVSRDAEALETARTSLGGGSVETLPADLSRPDEVERVAKAATDVDILVNNAGAIPGGSFMTVTDARWREGWELKVFGYIALTRALYPVLSRRPEGGVVVNIIGQAGENLDPNYVAGAVGNAALIAFTKSVGSTSYKDNVRVVGINPGATMSERMEKMERIRAEREFGDPERWEEFHKAMPFGRPAHPEEIADAAAFLASPRSAYTTGVTLTIGQPFLQA